MRGVGGRFGSAEAGNSIYLKMQYVTGLKAWRFQHVLKRKCPELAEAGGLGRSDRFCQYVFLDE
jgi:hypothetical protein